MKQTILEQKSLSPIIKWVGGKTQIMSHILSNLPPQWDKDRGWYHEPFLGGSAVMLNLRPRYAIAGDINAELVNLYNVVRTKLHQLKSHLDSNTFQNTKYHYYIVRDQDKGNDYSYLSEIFKAARFLYLNKHGYRGMCRYNLKGEFNIPYGNYKSVEYDFENIKAVSNYLNDKDNTIAIFHHHWEESMYTISEGDFVYLDPPYDPLSATANFVGYSNHGFSKDDQLALKIACDKLSSEGAYFMQSNAATPFILDLYKDYNQVIIPVNRQINAKEKTREKVNEVLITNY